MIRCWWGRAVRQRRARFETARPPRRGRSSLTHSFTHSFTCAHYHPSFLPCHRATCLCLSPPSPLFRSVVLTTDADRESASINRRQLHLSLRGRLTSQFESATAAFAHIHLDSPPSAACALWRLSALNAHHNYLSTDLRPLHLNRHVDRGRRARDHPSSLCRTPDLSASIHLHRAFLSAFCRRRLGTDFICPRTRPETTSKQWLTRFSRSAREKQLQRQ